MLSAGIALSGQEASGSGAGNPANFGVFNDLIMATAPVKSLHRVLWVAQILLSLFMLSGTILKWMPIEKISGMMPWTGQLPQLIVRLLGLIDLLGALGLILPGLLRIRPRLTLWAAGGVLALMVCAILFHISRGESNVIGVNVVAGAMAAFILWGRVKSV